MPLERFARELDETGRQTHEMAERITMALGRISSADTECQTATHEIIVALQAQDRIEQRCRNLARALRAIIASNHDLDQSIFDAVWKQLELDEFTAPHAARADAATSAGECDFF